MEYLADGSDDCPLARVYDFAPAEVTRLAAAAALAAGTKRPFAVHDWPGVEAVGGCELRLAAGRRDRGLVYAGPPAAFECVLTPDSWDDVARLTEPFLSECDGYQWLSTRGTPPGSSPRPASGRGERDHPSKQA